MTFEFDNGINEIIEGMTSRDTDKVWLYSNRIISKFQNREEIQALIPFLSDIKKKTEGLEMGGGFFPNQRFIDHAIKVIEFHRDSSECPCSLYMGHSFDPRDEVAKGYIKINEIVPSEGWPEYYMVACEKCTEEYKVKMFDAHFTSWEWEKA